MKTFETPKLNLVIIVGPTAVGKTELSIQLAKILDGEIISADSRLFYRGMNIGTAKPTKIEMNDIRHHLIDVADPDETWSLGQFKGAVDFLIREISQRDHLPILVGGTGQYIRAISDGWLPPEVIPNNILRGALEKMADNTSSERLHDQLRLLDPVAASIIDHRNIRRTIRALEVILQTGIPFSKQRTTTTSPYHCLFVGLMRPRVQLYERVDQRIELMFENGLLAEVEGLLRQGFTAHSPSMSAIGYREATSVLDGTMTLAQAKAEMKRLTRAFIRRQANWFKPEDPRIHWFDPNLDILDPIYDLVQQHLKT